MRLKPTVFCVQCPLLHHLPQCNFVCLHRVTLRLTLFTDFTRRKGRLQNYIKWSLTHRGDHREQQIIHSLPHKMLLYSSDIVYQYHHLFVPITNNRVQLESSLDLENANSIISAHLPCSSHVQVDDFASHDQQVVDSGELHHATHTLRTH